MAGPHEKVIKIPLYESEPILIYNVEVTNEKTRRIIIAESVVNVEGLDSIMRHFLCYNTDKRNSMMGQTRKYKVVKARGLRTNERHYSVVIKRIGKVEEGQQ